MNQDHLPHPEPTEPAADGPFVPPSGSIEDVLTEEEAAALMGGIPALAGAGPGPTGGAAPHPAPKKDPVSRDVLSRDELSVLLEEWNPSSPAKPAAANSSEAVKVWGAPGTSAGAEKRHRIIPYNFRRPDRVSKDQVRSLYLLHDTFANNLSASLAIFLRAICEVTLLSIEQQAYLEYLHQLPDPTVIYKLAIRPLQGLIVMEMNLSIAFPIIDRQLGGLGKAEPHLRSVTEIEQKILEGFLRVVTEELRQAWEPIVDLDFEVMGCETRPQLLQIVAPNEVVLTLVFEVQIDGVRGTLSLCIPAITLEPVIHKFNQLMSSRNLANARQTRALLDHLACIDFPVAAELHGTSITVADLLNLMPGDVLQLERRVTDPIEINIGERIKFVGDLVALNARKAVYLRSWASQATGGTGTGTVEPEPGSTKPLSAATDHLPASPHSSTRLLQGEPAA